MNFQQLEYIIAIDKHRHFVKAAEACFVTQATLSMMIKKLEEELEVKIFDRSKQPVVPTEIGKKIILQAKVTLGEAQKIKDLVRDEQDKVSGELRIGIIPTLAPYLLPLFLPAFLKNYPLVSVQISELTTEEIIKRLEQNEIDAGILATPLENKMLIEKPLFYEQFVVYASKEEKFMNKKYLLAEDIDVNRLWLLEEGHCLRSQVVNLCELKSKEKEVHQLDFAAASIETLKKIVEINNGITIIPSLALADMNEKQLENIRYFKNPAPVREIGLVTYRHFIKEKLLLALENEIIKVIPKDMKTLEKKEILKIT
ncbi:hydrogen peroxide-inducible genes activator [Bernardetia sp.]|uniref:hydrogen peroxide-inducible genes activator n=1 Tax=Bernardetia sp. TaxID=1937974 RepID=UPI0025B9D769|nr:hydrogen peroxide-inducible genes activator [Bernardetia sp.]